MQILQTAIEGLNYAFNEALQYDVLIRRAQILSKMY